MFRSPEKKFEKRRSKKASTGVTVPKSLEEAPMRRQDRRTLNALRRRRADR